MKNFHLPLPEQTYNRLRAEAERTQVPRRPWRARPSIGGCGNNSEMQGTTRSRLTRRKWREPISISTPIWSRLRSSTS